MPDMSQLRYGEKETHSPKAKTNSCYRLATSSLSRRECHIQTIDALEPEMGLSPSQTPSPCDGDDDDDDDDADDADEQEGAK